jgi:hypothetical protein
MVKVVKGFQVTFVSGSGSGFQPLLIPITITLPASTFELPPSNYHLKFDPS